MRLLCCRHNVHLAERDYEVQHGEIALGPPAISRPFIRWSGRPAFFSKEVSGGAPEVLLTDREDLHELTSWDGGLLLFTLRAADGNFDIWSLDPDTGIAQPVLTTPSNETEPASRGGWLAYVSDATGREEVYLSRPDRPGDAIQASVGGGRSPRWSPEGATLFYRRAENLFSVRIPTEDGNGIGSPELVWTMEVDRTFETRPGGGFLVAEKPPPPPQIVVVSNFTAELPKEP
jgi:hypothetical protein